MLVHQQKMIYFIIGRMPWQGNEDNLIDRFDVRAHLDWIPEPVDTIDVDIALTSEDRHINYERYRIIVQNEFLGGTLLVFSPYRDFLPVLFIFSIESLLQ